MTDISVKLDPETGAALVQLRDIDQQERRFRLRDTLSEKYLTRRGWTKTVSFLPGEAAVVEGGLDISLDPELAKRIPQGAALSLEQPASGFAQPFEWKTTAPADAAAPASEPEDADAEIDEAAVVATFSEEVRETLADADSSNASSDERKEPEQEKPAPAAELPQQLEPAIMAYDLEDRNKDKAANDDRRGNWKVPAIAAGICLALGLGIGAWGFGSSSTAVKEAKEAAAIQLERQKSEFERQITALKQQAETASLEGNKQATSQLAAIETRAEQALRERDAARNEVVAKDTTIKDLERRLANREAELAALKDEAGKEADAATRKLEERIAVLTAELDKTTKTLAERDGKLRETETRVAALTEQLNAARQQHEDEKAELGRQLEALKASLDTGRDQLAAREKALAEAEKRLKIATDELAAARAEAESREKELRSAESGQVASLTAEIRKRDEQLAERDAALRDVQAKLAVANVQVDALKLAASKSAQADLEKKSLEEKVASLTRELDAAAQNLSDREAKLAEAAKKLQDAETRLKAASEQKVASAAQDTTAIDPDAYATEAFKRLEEERDLYAEELKSLTSKFSALQEEKTKLEKEVASLEQKLADPKATASTPGRAVWGATAIDRNGAIYSLQNQLSEQLAQDNVNAICRGKSGGRCQPLAAYSNACISVARFEGEDPANDNYAYFVHRDWKVAAQTARERCESMGMACTVRFTACSPDSLSKPVSE